MILSRIVSERQMRKAAFHFHSKFDSFAGARINDCVPLRVVRLSSGTILLGTTAADGNGFWSITTSALPAGTHRLIAQVVDAAGNASPYSPALPVTIDLTPPTVQQVSLLTVADRRGRASVQRIAITFSEPVRQAEAETLSNYQLIGVGRRPKPAPLVAANYSAQTVTLSLVRPLSAKSVSGYALRVESAAALTDLAGNLLDGDSNQSPGGMFYRPLTGVPVLPASPSAVASAVDEVLQQPQQGGVIRQRSRIAR